MSKHSPEARESLERMERAFNRAENWKPSDGYSQAKPLQAALRELVDMHKHKTSSLDASDIRGRIRLAKTIIKITALELGGETE